MCNVSGHARLTWVDTQVFARCNCFAIQPVDAHKQFSYLHIGFFLTARRVQMASSKKKTSDMITSVAAQIMILYDHAMTEKNTEAAHAYALALNLLRRETRGIKISFDGPPPTLRRIPEAYFPEDLAERLPPKHRPEQTG